MPNYCSVPNCRGYYKTRPKVSVFIFPSDPELRGKWICAFMREEFEPTKNSKVRIIEELMTVCSKKFSVLFKLPTDYLDDIAEFNFKGIDRWILLMFPE